MTAPWAKEQPKHGDTVLHCGHLDTKKHHFFKYEGGVIFKRPDGSTGSAEWIVQCPQCFSRVPEHGPTVNGDSKWVGDEPAIKDMRGT